jgi:uncharacterized protein YecE (DUF72 family)
MPGPSLEDAAVPSAIDAGPPGDLFAEPETIVPTLPAGLARILVGTAAWTDPSLIKCGRFYPRGCNTAEDRLRFYAGQFPIVEVNSSYYAVPNAQTSQLWAERTPSRFVFNVKAFRLLTGHQTSREALPTAVREPLHISSPSSVFYRDVPPGLLDVVWAQFRDALAPLQNAGKLGTVHFQFAPWFTRSARALAHLDEIRDRLPEYMLSIEFRHQSWLSDEHVVQTLEFMMERGFVHTVVDSPTGLPNSAGLHWRATNPRLGLLRLHGRNAHLWNVKGASRASDRFDYDYSDQELEELAASVMELSRKVEVFHVIFNNNNEDQGQRNARTMMRLLGAAKAT